MSTVLKRKTNFPPQAGARPFSQVPRIYLCTAAVTWARCFWGKIPLHSLHEQLVKGWRENSGTLASNGHWWSVKNFKSKSKTSESIHKVYNSNSRICYRRSKSQALNRLCSIFKATKQMDFWSSQGTTTWKKVHHVHLLWIMVIFGKQTWCSRMMILKGIPHLQTASL